MHGCMQVIDIDSDHRGLKHARKCTEHFMKNGASIRVRPLEFFWGFSSLNIEIQNDQNW